LVLSIHVCINRGRADALVNVVVFSVSMKQMTKKLKTDLFSFHCLIKQISKKKKKKKDDDEFVERGSKCGRKCDVAFPCVGCHVAFIETRPYIEKATTHKMRQGKYFLSHFVHFCFFMLRVCTMNFDTVLQWHRPETEEEVSYHM
jgi:hypothetical protein